MKCMFSVKGLCNSDYGKGIECKGKRPVGNCPYVDIRKNVRR